jgi:hypothetical protein
MDEEIMNMVGLGGGSSSGSGSGSGSSWESWFQKAGSAVIGVAGQNQQFNNDFELQKLKMQSMNPYGQYYKDGQPMMAGMGGINPSMLLLIGVAVVAVMMLKD